MNEVTTTQLGFRDGLFGGAYYVIINPDKFKSLSPAHQKAIEETSGEWLARTIGKAWDDAEIDAIAQLKSSFTWASDDLNKAVMSRLKPIEEKFLGELNGKGVNAGEAISFLRAEAKKARTP